ncbi:hypothetical protein MTO96_049008 [Rhipicephalus appendiculatus]
MKNYVVGNPPGTCKAWCNCWSLHIVLSSNLCQFLRWHSTRDLFTLNCWSSNKSWADMCRESVKNIQDLSIYKLLSLQSWREDSSIPMLSLSSLENFFFVENYIQQVRNYFQACGVKLISSRKQKKRSLYMNVAPIFQNGLSLSQTML